MTDFRKIVSPFRERNLILLLLGFVAALQTILILAGEGAYGGADNIGHFRIARYAFLHPELFFDHWGKPVFTLLFAPVAQLGFVATQLLNVLLGILSLWLVSDLLKQFSVTHRWPVVLFGAFAPMNFMLMQSCLTEVLMGLFLVAAIWLIFKSRLEPAAILLSFLPFVRTESIVVLPLFVLYFAFHRRFFPVLLLVTGSLLYSVAGYFVYNDVLWIFRKMPYSLGDSIYGSGEVLHFVKNLPLIVGVPFLVLLIVGILDWGFKVGKSIKPVDSKLWFFVLVNGSWGLYFAAHSYVWWQGTGGSLGLIRVIAAVIPLMAVPAVLGFNRVADWFKPAWVGMAILTVLTAWQLWLPIQQHPLPFKWERPQQLMQEAANYLRTAKPAKIFYFDPFLLHFMGIDPFNPSLNNWGAGDRLTPSNAMAFGDILVWDAHFGPNEGGVALSNAMEDPLLQLERTFIPAENFKVLGGYDYGIYIFKKVPDKTITEPTAVVERELDFTRAGGSPNTWGEGKPLLKMDNTIEFSPSIKVALSEIKAENFIELTASVGYYPEEQLQPDAVLLILTVEQGTRSIAYNKADMVVSSAGDGRQSVEMVLRLAPEYPEGTMLNLYVWNKDRKKLWLENIQLSAIGH